MFHSVITPEHVAGLSKSMNNPGVGLEPLCSNKSVLPTEPIPRTGRAAYTAWGGRNNVNLCLSELMLVRKGSLVET